MSKSVLVDYIGSIEVTPQQINESMNKNNGKIIVSGIMQRGSSGGDKNFNQNGRSYPLPILKKETENYKNTFVKERRALGELDHPDSQVVNLSNVSHNVLDLWWQGNDLMGKIEILSTPSGNIAKELLKCGIRLGISSRGMGSVKELGEGKVEVQNDFEIVCWDLVSNPSTQGAFMNPSLNEGVNSNTNNKYTKINSLISEIISVM
jgi:hypothetical protein|tara:strand:- start:351 stop:968 length:618 start_codon:yes stop_codon:yes gene_type:complete